MQGGVVEQIRSKGMNLVVVSNRAPFAFRESPGGKEMARVVSGLVSALEPIMAELGGTWVGWCGRVGEKSGPGKSIEVPPENPSYNVKEIFLTGRDYQQYYHGFSNDCLWPLSHCFIEKCNFSHQNWESYVRVNQVFAEAAGMASREGLVWVHDYHLALVPAYLRKTGWTGKVAFFWHIPFPPLEIFSVLPWGKEILQGLLESDLLAFHLTGYVENFLQAVERMLGLPVDYRRGIVKLGNRAVQLKALPIGVDYRRFQVLASDAGVQKQARRIRDSIPARFLFLGVERLDYTKGILEKLKGVERFLEKYPAYAGEVVFLQVAVPTRTEVDTYANLRRRVEEAVGHINGRFGKDWQMPVRYTFRSLDPQELVAHYLAADAILVTPLRDGLNLVAKEFVASRVNQDGVLVLSPFAGAAEQLTGSLLANPYDPEDMADKIKAAVDMSREEQKENIKFMQEEVFKYDVHWWLQGVLAGLLQQPGNVEGGFFRKKGTS